MTRRMFFNKTTVFLMGILGLSVKAKESVKSCRKRRIWPIDWPEIYCPKCHKRNLALTLMHKDKEDIGCICHSCGCQITAMWDDDKKIWLITKTPVYKGDWKNNWIIFDATSIDVNKSMQLLVGAL